jgi:hypothetical protein
MPKPAKTKHHRSAKPASKSNIVKRQIAKREAFVKRRPHRTLRLTRRRDAERSFKIAGYRKFSGEVWHLIWSNKGMFAKFIILYAVLSALVVGTLSQANYVSLRDMLVVTTGDKGLENITTLFFGAMTSGTGEQATIASQLIAGILFLFGWLVIVWMLRSRILGKEFKFRDALYQAGAPIMSTLSLLAFIVLQLLPFAVALVAYATLTNLGAINWAINIENMAAWLALAMIGILSLYWLTTSFVALVVVTNHGVYPLAAVRIAAEMVVGRRSRLMLRLLFMMLPLAVMWVVLLVPAILIDNALQVNWLPLVPMVVLMLSTLSLVWVSSYIYLLYRRLLDDHAPTVKA